MLHLYAPASNSDLIVYLMMLLGALLLSFAAGYFTHAPSLDALNSIENKLRHDLERISNQNVTGTSPAPEPTAKLRSPANPLATASENNQDDLTRIHGISIEIQESLYQTGIHSYRQLQLFNPLSLKHQISRDGDETKIEEIIVWQQQAALAAANKWDDLTSLQAELNRTNKSK